ncbi:MAG: sugar nucleotide-binding protein [Burkholderiales bacterium]|nr:sugar nucleotide-binding protein [Burkholderiales bacterium]
MSRHILVLGATGMLGQEIVSIAKHRGFMVTGLARKSADINIDLTDTKKLKAVLDKSSVDIIVNAAALVSIEMCQELPDEAFEINANLVSVLADFCQGKNLKLIQISTDHYFNQDGIYAHSETDQVKLVNEYARTKYAGEMFASTIEEALILRTNIVGFRGLSCRPTFLEWLIGRLRNRRPLEMYSDVFHSPIDVNSFVHGVFDLEARNATGTINLAGSEVVSKEVFIRGVAGALEIELDWATTGSAPKEGVPRANSMGLDVSLAESALGYKLPTVLQVVKNLLA